MRLRPIPGLVACLLAALPALAREPLRPAELPPPDFRGQQYVDSKGCAFVRAGTGGEDLWIPRVSREGKPLCIGAPSGKRAPVAEEGAAPKAPAETASTPAASNAATGGYFVAVGSFGVAENADKAESRLRGMDYGVVRGSVQGGSGSLVTVFAGPFADAATAAAVRRLSPVSITMLNPS